MTEQGYEKAQSDNLPKVDAMMVASFYANNSDFLSAEIRGYKAARSCREDYGDNAVGYVQIKRMGDMCCVKGRVTPEHKIRKKAYSVEFICNETEQIIDSCQCQDCPASQGGCKHAVAFLSWLNMRSEEPSKTSVECYWKRSVMSGIGTSIKLISAKDLGKKYKINTTNPDDNLLSTLVEENMKRGLVNNQLMNYFTEPTNTESLSIHNMLGTFHIKKIGSTADDFIHFCKTKMNINLCKKAAKETVGRSNSPLWHNLRYARVTASKLHEVANCKTIEGSLVESLLRAKLRDTTALQRGRTLEEQVLRVVEEINNIKFKKCGLFLFADFPIFGASPDGISKEYVLEVKCPMTETALKKYFSGNQPSPKYMAQIQLQMLFTGKFKALYCVASPDFEKTKKIFQCIVNYDDTMCKNIVSKATVFWKDAVK